MNRIYESMKEIKASEELKKNTMEYLKSQQRRIRARRIRRYALAAACLCLLMLAGGYTVYIRPVSYISIDVNPSVELGVNRFGRVVEADAYNKEGQELLKQMSLKHTSYLKAIGTLLECEENFGYLTKDARVFITVISDGWKAIFRDIRADEISEKYGAQTYTSDLDCREQAHRQEMSFGKYRAALELSQCDETVTVNDCHGMSVGEIEDRISTCKGHQEEHYEGQEEYHENQEERYENQEEYYENQEEHYENQEYYEDQEDSHGHHGGHSGH